MVNGGVAAGKLGGNIIPASLTLNIEINLAEAHAEGFLLSGLTVRFNVLMLGTCLVREQNHFLCAHSLRIDINAELKPDFFKIVFPNPQSQ